MSSGKDGYQLLINPITKSLSVSHCSISSIPPAPLEAGATTGCCWKNQTNYHEIVDTFCSSRYKGVIGLQLVIWYRLWGSKWKTYFSPGHFSMVILNIWSMSMVKWVYFWVILDRRNPSCTHYMHCFLGMHFLIGLRKLKRHKIANTFNL